MEHLLLLVHRIPYPPNKGDKIRSYHLLRHLAKHYHVHLGTFIDDPNDWQYVDTVKQWCVETHFAQLSPSKAKLRSFNALIHDRALSIDYYRDTALQSWVNKVIQTRDIKRVLVFSSSMAQYVEHALHMRRIIDFVDIDSDKWAQYAAKKLWPMRWLYQREAKKLLQYEKKIAQEFDASLFVSEAESALFKTMAPESKHKIGFLSNGVDTDYFSPLNDYLNPYLENEVVLVFTGAMDYWPNIDAVQWFAEEIFPSIRKSIPAASFYIVGSRPTAHVHELAEMPGVRVTGTVPDVRPYLAHARASVAPLRIARGIQNKVLEAMAMGMCVIVSPQALEGIDAEDGRDLILAKDAPSFITKTVQLLQKENPGFGKAARQRVETLYGWTRHLSHVDALLEAHNESTLIEKDLN